MQDFMQDLASLARKLLARFACFLQDRFYWVVTDIYKQEPTLGEFLNTHLKNSILQYSLQLLVVVFSLYSQTTTYNCSVVHIKY